MKKLAFKLVVISFSAILIYSLLNSRELSINLEQKHFPAFIIESLNNISKLPFVDFLYNTLHSSIRRSSEYLSVIVGGKKTEKKATEEQIAMTKESQHTETINDTLEPKFSSSDNITQGELPDNSTPAQSKEEQEDSDLSQRIMQPLESTTSASKVTGTDNSDSANKSHTAFSPTLIIEVPPANAREQEKILLKVDAISTEQLLAMGDTKAIHSSLHISPYFQENPQAPINSAEINKSVQNTEHDQSIKTYSNVSQHGENHGTILQEEKQKELTKHHKIPTKHLPAKILLTGDSMMEEVYVVVSNKKQFKTPRIKYIFAAKHSTGLSNGNYYNWFEHMEEFLKKHHPDIVLIFIGANDLQNIRYGAENYVFNTEGWKNRYRELSEKLVILCKDYGATPIWIGLPSMGTKQMKQWIPLLSSLQEEACRNQEVLYIDTVPLLADKDGNYQTHYTLKNGKRVLLRAKDKIHLSSDGTAIVMEHVIDYLNEILDEEFLPVLPQETNPSGKKK